MKLWIGTSGYSYPEWKGSFYPDSLPANKMFGFYSQRFSTVEINATFYRMPTDKLVMGWLKEAPPGFRYTFKAPKTISHIKKFKDCADPLSFFLGRADKLGDHRAALLFQIPPFIKKDIALLKDFMALVPPALRPAYEFRDASWHDDAVFSAIAEAGAALCISDAVKIATPLVATTSWGYLRLRDEGYDRADIARWHERILAQKWSEAYVYFKHEDAGKGAEFALVLREIAGDSGAAQGQVTPGQ